MNADGFGMKLLNWLSDVRNRDSGSASATCSGSPEGNMTRSNRRGPDSLHQQVWHCVPIKPRHRIPTVGPVDPCIGQPFAIAGNADREHAVPRYQPVESHGTIRVYPDRR